MSTLNLSNINSKFRTVAIVETVDRYKIPHTGFLETFVIHLHAEFRKQIV